MSETPKMYKVDLLVPGPTITRVMSEDQLKKFKATLGNVQRRFVPFEGYNDIWGAENTPETVVNLNLVHAYTVREVKVKDE